MFAEVSDEQETKEDEVVHQEPPQDSHNQETRATNDPLAKERTCLSRQTPIPALTPVPPSYVSVYWAPFSADTKVNRATFHAWVQSVPSLANSNIPWAEATCSPDGRVLLNIRSNHHNRLLRDIGCTVVSPNRVRQTVDTVTSSGSKMRLEGQGCTSIGKGGR